jgi:hypothetical protein
MTPQPIHYDRLRSAISLHRALEKDERRPAIPALRHEDIENLTP